MRNGGFVICAIAIVILGISLTAMSETSGGIVRFQQPTYLIEKDTPGLDIYTCDVEKDACKVNLDFRDIVPTNEPSTHFACSVSYGFGITGEEDTCNPSTIIFPTGSWVVSYSVKKVSDDTIVVSGQFSISNPSRNVDPTHVTLEKKFQTPSYILEKDDITLQAYSCDTSEAECRVNLLFTPLLDGVSSSRLTCTITGDFPLETTTDPCNLGTSTIPIGTHTLTIDILEKSSQNVLITQIITFTNTPPDTSIDPTTVVADIAFQQPTYLLGKDDASLSSYTCDTTKESCKVNILVTPKLLGEPSDRLGCTITGDFGISFDTCNPGVIEIPAGTHTLTVSILDTTKNTVLQTREISIINTPPVVHSGGGGSGYGSLDFSQVTITVQSGLDDQFTCKTKKCSVNLLAVVPSGALCRWDFGGGEYTTAGTDDKCNPGFVRFSRDALITLIVTDPHNSANFIQKELKVFRNATPEIVPKVCENCTRELQGKIQISAVLPNPVHADTVEWIELHNISSQTLDLHLCTIGDAKKSYDLRGILEPYNTLRLYQAFTHLSLGNTKENLTLICSGTTVDAFSWDFAVPENYILRREILLQNPQFAVVKRAIDGDTLEVLLDGQKETIRLLGVDTPETVHPNKPVQEFGIEASNFTKQLAGFTIWLTFDVSPIDHYGRRLAYVWVCPNSIEWQKNSTQCKMFNEILLREGYARMERRFPFAEYSGFDTLEKEAKKAKKGLWALHDVADAMKDLSDQEKTNLKNQKEEEYLQIQKEILDQCVTGESSLCDDTPVNWQEQTTKISTLSFTSHSSGVVVLDGRTWEHSPLELAVFQGDVLIQSWLLESDTTGAYGVEWYPRNPGSYRAQLVIRENDAQVTLEKELHVESVSPNFLDPLQVNIDVQGTFSKKRWIRGDEFHCQSRGSCSVNVAAISNHASEVDYLWIMPDGTLNDSKNPLSIKLGYGTYPLTLLALDSISEEITAKTLQVIHNPIPRKVAGIQAFKNDSRPKTFTLDLKSISGEALEAGGVPPDMPRDTSPMRKLFTNIILILLIGGITLGVFIGRNGKK